MPQNVHAQPPCCAHAHAHRRRPYECDVCGQRFSEAVNLGVHMRMHTGEQPYECDGCGRTFSVLSKMRSHRDTHPAVCPPPNPPPPPLYVLPFLASLLQNPFPNVPAIRRVNLLHSFRACCVVWQVGVAGWCGRECT